MLAGDGCAIVQARVHSTAFISTETIIRSKIWHRWAALALFGLTGVASATPLEDLFNGPDKPRFFAEARVAADAGDVEALFLLGKAYNLGVGIEVDRERARELYRQARAKGSARASHNLGLMALDAGNRSEAIALLEEALARGLVMPTLHNLGRAYTPPEDPVTFSGLSRAVVPAGRAGDYFARAHALLPNGEEGYEASVQYLRAWSFARRSRDDSFDLPALRQRAVKWLQIGIDRDHAPSWANFGAMLYAEGDHEGARPPLERAAASGNGIAHYHLAKLDDFTRSFDSALLHYEKAALAGVREAREPAIERLREQLRNESDPAALERGQARMKALLAVGRR